MCVCIEEEKAANGWTRTGYWQFLLLFRCLRSFPTDFNTNCWWLPQVSYYNLYDEMLWGWVVLLLFQDCFLLEYRIPNINYQMHWKGWIMTKDLEKKDEISLSLPPLPLSLCVCVRICTYVGRYSFPSHLTFTFTSTSTFTYTKFQITAFPIIPYLTTYQTLRYLYTKPHFPIIPSHAYIHLCTVLYRIYNK